MDKNLSHLFLWARTDGGDNHIIPTLFEKRGDNNFVIRTFSTAAPINVLGIYGYHFVLVSVSSFLKVLFLRKGSI